MKMSFDEIFQLGNNPDGTPITVKIDCLFFGRRMHKGDIINEPKIANNPIDKLQSRSYSGLTLDSGLLTVSCNME
jgi:hypothetical protein